MTAVQTLAAVEVEKKPQIIEEGIAQNDGRTSIGDN